MGEGAMEFFGPRKSSIFEVKAMSGPPWAVC
jgi:hypothetical protein